MHVSAGVTQEEGHTGFLHMSSAVLALIFLVRRIPLFLSLVDREVEIFVFQRMNRCPLVGHFFCQEKSQFVSLHRDSNSRPNVRRCRGYLLNHRGDPS